MSNKFFHYSTNQEVEQYLSELTQQCGFKHKTQLINAIFNGEVLTVQSDDLTLHNNQSALFKRNAQQLLDLDTQLRVHLPDTNPIDFDISQYQSMEDKITAAERKARTESEQIAMEEEKMKELETLEEEEDKLK